VLPINVLMLSSVDDVLAGTWSHVLFRRAMGAVARAEMMEVNEEKLFKARHF
jgi:hypothetical protein